VTAPFLIDGGRYDPPAAWRLLLVTVALFLSSCSRPHGAGDTNQSVRFTYRGPNAVFLAGEFNGWSTTATPMQRKASGDWTVDLPLTPGKYQYKFVVNGEWFQDSENPESVPDGWGGKNSVITVPSLPISSSTAQPSASTVPGKETGSGLVRQVRWKRIIYPDVPVPGAPDKKLSFQVSSGGEGGGPKEEPEHLRFDLIWTGDDTVPPPTVLAHPEEIRVFLHLGDGFLTQATTDKAKTWLGVGNGLYATFSSMFILPWTRNSFDEAWIECRLPSQTYWIEIPYGFTRNPADPWPATDEHRGYPVLPPVMNNLPEADRIVPWLHVDYELGEIQNQWRLSAKLANPFDAAAEVVLYHDPDVGEPRWTGETPKTSVEIKRTGARDLDSARAGFYLGGFLDRYDVFTFGREDSEALGRGIGWITIHVDDTSYSFTIPSSLFKYVHGTADPENKRRVSRGEGLFEKIVQWSN
jgi:hypothetical protein